MKNKFRYIATGKVKKARIRRCPGYNKIKGKCKSEAESLAAPLIRRWNYESIFRQAVSVEPLPLERTLIPEFEVQSTPSIKLSEIEKRFNAKTLKNRKFKTIAKS